MTVFYDKGYIVEDLDWEELIASSRQIDLICLRQDMYDIRRNAGRHTRKTAHKVIRMINAEITKREETRLLLNRAA